MDIKKLKDNIWDDKIRARVEKEEALLARVVKQELGPLELKSLSRGLPDGEGLITLPADTTITIHESLAEETTIIPSAILEHLIRNASHRTIMNFCPCRDGSDCKDYPREFGCVFLGDAAKLISPELGRAATVEETLEYAQKCRDAGLIHQLGKFRGDLQWLNEGVGPHTKLLTVCNCCPCCCGVRVTMYLDKAARDRLPKLPGVDVVVTDDCTGCGECEAQCIFHAIEVKDGRARISDECRPCGRCAKVCPVQAIKITVQDPDYVAKTIRMISERVDYT